MTHKLNPEDMIKTLFIFSDMEFDEAVRMCNDPDSDSLEEFTTDYDTDSDSWEEPLGRASFYRAQLYLRSLKPHRREKTNYETIKVQFNIHMPPVGYYSGHVPRWPPAALLLQKCAASYNIISEKGMCGCLVFDNHTYLAEGH